MDPGGDRPPFFVLGYRLVKTYFNRIFPVSSLSFFFLPCLVIFVLNYVSISFDISIKKIISEIKRIPLMEMSGSASEIHVHLYIVVQCGLSSICEDSTNISVVDRVKFSVLVNKCVRPSCSFRRLYISSKKTKHTNKAGDSFLFYETWLCCLTIFIRYFRRLTLFSITNVVVLI